MKNIGSMMMIIDAVAAVVPAKCLITKNDGTPMAAAMEKQMSCRLVRFRATFGLTCVKSRGTGIYADMGCPLSYQCAWKMLLARLLVLSNEKHNSAV